MEPIQLELPTIFEDMTVNAWLFKEPEPTLIDCGENTDKLWDVLNNKLKANGLTIEDIKKVIITHAHLDHLGMAKRITDHSDATIWVSEYTYDWAIHLKMMLDRRTDVFMKVMEKNLPAKAKQQHFNFGYKELAKYWDEIPKDRIQVFPMEGSLNFGGDDWEIIYTPGHCINQTCFYNPKNGYLLSADMLLPMIPIPIIDADLKPPYKPVKSLAMQLESYEKLKKLHITKVFPGHFTSFENARTLIEKQENKIHSRKERCYELLQNGSTQVMELVHAIYPKRINDATIFMVVGFLDILQEEGRINFKEIDGMYHYYPNEKKMIYS